jgi:hypothetical protein
MRSRTYEAETLFSGGFRGTKYDVAKVTDCDHRTAAAAICRLRSGGAAIRIAKWIKRGVRNVAIYETGEKRDAKKPAVLTPAARMRRVRHKQTGALMKSATEDIRILLRKLPVGQQFTYGTLASKLPDYTHKMLSRTLIRLAEQGEISVVVAAKRRGLCTTYEVAALAPPKKKTKQKQKTEPRRRAEPKVVEPEPTYPAPRWAAAWPHVYVGFTQRHKEYRV